MENKVALVIEGGAMRGAFLKGVLDCFTIYDASNDPDGSIAIMTDELKRDYGLSGAPFVDPRDLGLEPFVGFNPDKIEEVIDKLK